MSTLTQDGTVELKLITWKMLRCESAHFLRKTPGIEIIIGEFFQNARATITSTKESSAEHENL